MPRYIDADRLNEILVSGFIDENDALVESPEECNSMLVWAIQEAKGMPTADVVEIVRCKDCEFYDEDEKWCRRLGLCGAFDGNDFCSKGEMKENDSVK